MRIDITQLPLDKQTNQTKLSPQSIGVWYMYPFFAIPLYQGQYAQLNFVTSYLYYYNIVNLGLNLRISLPILFPLTMIIKQQISSKQLDT